MSKLPDPPCLAYLHLRRFAADGAEFKLDFEKNEGYPIWVSLIFGGENSNSNELRGKEVLYYAVI